MYRFERNGIVFHITFYNSLQFSEGGLKRDVIITSFTTSIFFKICHSVNMYLKHVSCFWTTLPYIVLHLACEHWYENVSKFHSTELVQTIQNIHPVSFLKVSFQYTCSLNVAFYGFLLEHSNDAICFICTFLPFVCPLRNEIIYFENF